MSSNIKVGIRVRPLISREKNEKLKEQWEVNENSMYPFDVTSGKRNGDIYNFDHIFDSSYCNADIYDTIVHPVVDKAMNGFNGTIFAYGQTSSGKTYTMMGDANENGLISLAVRNIFLAIEQSVNRKFLLRVSYMEIYNEKIYDLLDIKNTVKISEDYNGSVIVNVKEEVTDSAEKIYDIMKKGDKARRIGETNMNEKSSRSHTIFRIIIETSEISDTSVVNIAHLNLVDLAGSERATLTKTSGQRLKEGAHINKSLSTLSLVMKQLSESKDFISFRDSKLTRILQPSLGGNALTAIICAVTPAALEETHSTLAFASRAKTVKNKPLLNEVVTDEALINRYALEISKLKRDLEKANNDKETLQAQKISVLEKCILMSKKSNNTNKNRRKTWCTTNDPNKLLPIIYETDVLRVTDHISTDKSINLDSEAFRFDDYPLPSHSLEKKMNTPCTSSRSDTLSPFDSKYASNGQPVKKSEEVLKWLVHSATETPKSVLKERAEYYEQEYNSLKELTSREKLVMTDDTPEIEMLKTELIHIKSELESERLTNKEQETKFFKEKKVLESKLDKLKNKNDELSKLVQKIQKDYEQQNDCEYLVDMYKEKYKKREKELLDSLQEAREQLKSNINNTDDEKNQIISTDVSITVDIKVFLEECKNQLGLLKSELESEQPMSVIQKMFNEIKKLNDEMLVNCTDCSDDLQDLLNVFKYMFDLSSIILTDDAVIFELVKEKNLFQHREKTYELLVSKQDEEIKHLSENILQYMNELAFHKNEVIKYKEIAKSETSLQNDLDFSIMTTDTKNMTDYDINNESTLNQSELILQNDQYVQTEEDFPRMIQLKDKEIEDISDKIMEYIEQLSAVEEELNQLKYVSKADKLFPDDILIKEKNYEIAELTKAVNVCEEKINEYASELQSEKRKVKEKDQEIVDLSNNIMTCLSEIHNLNDEIKQIKVQIQNEKGLINTKDKEFNTNDQPATELTEKVKSSEQLFVQENNESVSDIIMKQSIEGLLAKYGIKIIEFKNEIRIFRPSDVKEDLQEDTLKMQEEEKLNELKDNQIAVLNTKVIKLTQEICASQYEREKYKNFNTVKDNEIQVLLYKLSDAEHEICVLKSKADINRIQYKSDIEEKIELLNSKNTEIEDLTNKAIIFENQKTEHEEFKELKKCEIQELHSKILYCNKRIKEYAFQLEEYENLIRLKDDEIKNTTEKLVENKNIIFEKDKIINIYMRDLESEKDISKKTNEYIQNIRKEYWNQIAEFEKEIDNLKSALNEKDDVIVLREHDIKSLSDKLNQYAKQLEELILRSEKLTQVSSEYETLFMKIKAEEVKSIQYVTKIKSLEQQLRLSNEEAKQMEQEYEVVKTSNLNYSTMIEHLQNQICTPQGYVTHQECTLDQYKDHNNQLKSERNEVLENNTLLRDTSLTEIQKATVKLQENKKYIENLQKELVTVQNNNTDLIQEMVTLKKKNEDYKKIVAQVTQKTNSKMLSYNNIGIKLKRDNNLLKMQISAEEEKTKKTHNQLIVLQEELQKKGNSYELDKLQTKVNNLEENNKKLTEMIEDSQGQLYIKGNELKAMKKTVETLKYENSELLKIKRDLNNKFCETEVLLKSAKSNVELLEKERESYIVSTRNLEECLEDLKFELYELKNKEREKVKKAKRQSLHDSSRSLSSDEQLSINTSLENQQLNLPCFEPNKSDDTKPNKRARYKQHMPLSDRQVDELGDKVTKLQNEYEILLKKYDQVKNLCRLRKTKIDELEKQIHS